MRGAAAAKIGNMEIVKAGFPMREAERQAVGRSVDWLNAWLSHNVVPA